MAAGTVNRVRRVLADFAPDVVHIASPFVLGWRAVQAAHALGVPSVCIHQTEVPNYAARDGFPCLEKVLAVLGELPGTRLVGVRSLSWPADRRLSG